jgi:2,5-furandicarboxylate decarboxylase 1
MTTSPSREQPVTKNLEHYLESLADRVWHVHEPVALRHGITALQYELDRRHCYPPVVVHKPVRQDGSIADIPVVTNLTASRELVAAALGLSDHRQNAEFFGGRIGEPQDPVIVSAPDAPVQQVVLEGSQVDVTRLPGVWQHELDPGGYLTAAHATTFDPDSGVDNTAIQRCWLKAPRRMSYFPYPFTHNYRNMSKFWAQGEPCPIAFWVGHHPAILMGTQAKLKYPESHWRAASSLIGEPLRLVPSVTHGEAIMVPADAEIVVEGFVPPGVLAADGPFGEYTGYMGGQTVAPICEVTCVTRRERALYHDYGSGLTDMLVPDNMAMEGKLFGLIKAVAPSLTNVYVPASGRRMHAYLQFTDPNPGEVRDGLTAALSYRRIKTAFGFDQDTDIFDDDRVNWALATRVQWSRDSFIIDGLSTSILDPSLPYGQKTGSKMAIDATLPRGSGPGPRPIVPRATVPGSDTAAAGQLVEAGANPHWPRF